MDDASIKKAKDNDDLSKVNMTKDVVNFYLKNSKEMKNLFNFITKNNPAWGLINITLAPNTIFKVDYNTFETKYQVFGLRLNGNMVINGNPGSVIQGYRTEGKDKKNLFMYLTPNAKLCLINVSLDKFYQDFMSYGTIYAHNSVFANNLAYKPLSDKQKEYAATQLWFGAVIHNFGSAYFDNCMFHSNKVELYYGDVLCAEKHALTIFDDCKFSKCSDKFIFAKESSMTIFYENNENIYNDLKNCYFEPGACLSIFQRIM